VITEPLGERVYDVELVEGRRPQRGPPSRERDLSGGRAIVGATRVPAYILPAVPAVVLPERTATERAGDDGRRRFYRASYRG